MSQKEKSKKIVLSIYDPEGRSVILYDDTWSHALEHPEIRKAGLIRVRKVIEKPTMIVHNEPRKALIYSDQTRIDLYFNVFAGTDDNLTTCNVRTVYLTRDIPKGDVIWLKSK